jgi:hypothetical protein
MRASIAFAILVAVCIRPAAALETARGLAATGAPHLALARAEQLQPRDTAAPRWAEWEALRMSLLVRLQRHDEALRRAGALPAGMPQPALRQCLLDAARAAVAVGQGETARSYVSRLLWQNEATPDEARAARLIAIESHIADRQGDTAFRAMLRFQQDYRPLGSGVAERFVEALLDLSRDQEAVNWLASLDDTSAARLRLQLRNGLAAPDAVVTQARAQIAKGGGPGYWQLLAEAAARQGNGELRIESLERLLNFGENDTRAPANGLWQAYLSEAQAGANQNRLLAGDDTAWLDFAARRLGTSPYLARALFGYLAQNGAARETRYGAQLQLAFSLYQDGLDNTALQLFSDGQAGPEALDTQARYLLGNIAETRNAPALAVRFWRGLTAPPNAGAEEWQVRLATLQWRAGMSEPAVNTMRELVKAAKPLPAAAATRAVALGRDMLAAGRPQLAEEMLAALLPLAGRDHARGILYTLGGIAESAGQFARAADYYLRSAMAGEPQTPDALALQARLAAALNLARAGYRGDARAQLDWLLKNSKDPAQIETARRELSRL